jgi:hypothetical protein
MKGGSRERNELSLSKYLLVDPHCFQCGSGFSIFCQCGFGSRSGVLMTKIAKLKKQGKAKKSARRAIRGKRGEYKEKTGIKTAVDLREKHDNTWENVREGKE